MRSEIERVIRFQEEVGLDVLVHGEPERNDMVQYFAEQMEGYAFTQNAWVQSYGSRYVRPPILYGDVNRPDPMTVEWTPYAQSLTEKPVKGMLTGPVTMLQWSFVRDDQPRSETCEQLALAIRDEVGDLERPGHQGDPGRRARDPRGAAAAPRPLGRVPGVGGLLVPRRHLGRRATRPRSTPTCATRTSATSWSRSRRWTPTCCLIEAARSRMELLHDWERTGYAQEIGPGVYDIHSPRVPAAEEMAELLRAAADVLDAEQLWVNPDCGLKTRGWPEVDGACATWWRPPSSSARSSCRRADGRSHRSTPWTSVDATRPVAHRAVIRASLHNTR